MQKFLAVVGVFAVINGYAQTAPYQSVVDHYHATASFNGVALVATDGKIDYLGAAGISNRQTGTTINTKTKFRIASVTKTFTAVLILQLYEEGKINLKIPFGKYYPQYKGEAKSKVTIEQLLTYSSGIPNQAEALEMKSYQLKIPIDTYIDRYCSGKLVAVPGTKSEYSNTEYILLHKIIELVTQQSYATVLQRRILDALQMTNSGLLRATDIVPGLTNSYTINDSTKAVTADEPYFIENFFGAGAMYSTVEDLLKFDQGIFNHQLMQPATTQLMLAPNKKLNDVALGVWYAGGYGVFSKPFIYRTGGILGASANWIHTIDDKKSIIVFNNTNGTNLYEMSGELYRVSNGEKLSYAATEQIVVPKKSLNTSTATGTWLIDLRPDPNSEAYPKDFIITPQSGTAFSGEFYGTAFNNGIFNTDWDQLYFAFSTSDNAHVYYHAGYINGDTIVGISYSSERKMTARWTGHKKP